MRTRALIETDALAVLDYVCDAGPHDAPYPEQHARHSISYVRAGSFGCQTLGASYELVAGSILIGRTGDEFMCTHDHRHGGDECLSFQLSPELVEQLGGSNAIWRSGSLPPLAELMVLGELAQRCAEGGSDARTDEIGMLLAERFVVVATQAAPARTSAAARDRKRAIDAALWLDERSHEDVDLGDVARQAELSPFHFLRIFRGTLGVTPHQYLVRSRLRNAACLLAEGERPISTVALDVGFADLSNFVRTFHRAAGVSPRAFRRLSRGDRDELIRIGIR
jgi:AraC family transcriptional regulator